MGVVASENGKQAPRPDEGKRLKIAIRTAAPLLTGAKERLTVLHGRELSWDEFFELLFGYVDLPPVDNLTALLTQKLTEIQNLLEENNEHNAVGCIEVFAPAIVDVIRGKLQSRKLTDAIAEA